jgi:hypothetical protein
MIKIGIPDASWDETVDDGYLTDGWVASPPLASS